MKKYKSATIFREALQSKVSSIAKKNGLDHQRIRRDIAFDRLLVRLFKMPSPPWALKGGYAMQLRTDNARTTKDVDMAIRDAKIFAEKIEDRNNNIKNEIIKQSNMDLGDFFSFLITGPVHDLSGPPEGGIRFHVEARLDDKTFEKFSLDIGAGDIWTDPLEELESSNLLSFAGFEPSKFLAIPKEQQFAEKYHAYTLPRQENRPNSRVKDLIDMNLLITTGLNSQALKSSLEQTFDKRNTHALDLNMMPPPPSWATTFSEMASDCNIKHDLKQGYQFVAEFVKSIK